MIVYSCIVLFSGRSSLSRGVDAINSSSFERQYNVVWDNIVIDRNDWFIRYLRSDINVQLAPIDAARQFHTGRSFYAKWFASL